MVRDEFATVVEEPSSISFIKAIAGYEYVSFISRALITYSIQLMWGF